MCDDFHEIGRVHGSNRAASARLAGIIGHFVQETSRRQHAAVDALLPVAARRGFGVVVLTADDGSWRAQPDERLAPWTIGHQPVETLAVEPEERSTHAD